MSNNKGGTSSIKVPVGGTGKGKIGISSVVDCLMMKGVHFETDKTFIKPSVKKALKSFANFANRPKERKILVLGHTDTVASKSYNLDLSKRRAKRVYDFITFIERSPHEQQGILDDLVTNVISKEKWGEKEAKEILGQNGLLIIGLRAPDLAGAIKYFQKYHMSNKIPTGKLDDETWKELYKAYINHFGIKISKDKFVSTPCIGCGEEHLRIPTGDKVDEPENRRVEFLFFASEPDPEDLKDCNKYDEWIKNSKKTCIDVERPCEISTIILSPALGFPGLGKPGHELEVIFLSKNDLSSYKEKLNFCWNYSTWDNKDNPDVAEPVETTSITKLAFQSKSDEGWVLKKEGKKLFKLSSLLMKKYEDKGFRVLLAKIKAPAKEGLYNLLNLKEIELTKGIFWPRETLDLKDTGVRKKVRIYHPFLISQKRNLNIAHVTDTHISLRVNQFQQDVYDKYPTVKGFCNPNMQFERILKAINEDSDIDIIIITGDLIDANRGYDSSTNLPPDCDHIHRNWVYRKDWNWVYFYMLLIENYQKPIFTLLGNHEFVGDPFGYAIKFPLGFKWYHFEEEIYKFNMLVDEMEQLYPGLFEEHPIAVPLSTINAQSVLWYNSVINPFLDYTVVYDKMSFLMFDWDVKWEVHDPLGEKSDLPYPENSLSNIQMELLDEYLSYSQSLESVVKIISMHAPVFHPYPSVGHNFLIKGEIGKVFNFGIESTHPALAYFDESNRNKLNYFEIDQLVDGVVYKHRNELVKKAIKKKITLFLTGHGHRNEVYQVKDDRVYFRRVNDISSWDLDSPVFVMTVSGGPIGIINEEGRLNHHLTTGKIEKKPGIEWRGLVKPGYRTIKFNSNWKIVSLDEKKVPDHGDKGDVVRRAIVSSQYGPKYPNLTL